MNRPSPWLAGIALVLAIIAGIDQTALRGQAADVKLTTTLADLAAAVPQDLSDVAPQPTAGAIRLLALDTLPKSAQDAVRGRRLRLTERNDVQVYVLMREVTAPHVKQIEVAGARIEIVDEGQRRVQALVPVTRLRRIAALPFVTFVRLPTYGIRHRAPRAGSVTSEGDRILNADVARQQFGLDGSGISVGAISDGLKGLFAAGCSTCAGASGGPIGSGDLPDAKGVRTVLGRTLVASTGNIVGTSFSSNHDLEGLPPPGCGFGGAGAEGVALLEIIHDLAPAARLAFANADTDLAFNQAVNFLAQSNDVVVDDLGFFGLAYDGTSSVSANTAAALNNPANRIRAYATSVGNSADQHYFGAYVNSGVDGTATGGISTPGRLHLHQQTPDTVDVLGLGNLPHNLISLPAGGEVLIFLSWDDPSGESANNYDLYLVRDNGNSVVARSTDVQSGGQDPLEVIDFRNSGATGLFRIVIQNVRDQAATRNLNLYSFQPQCADDGPRRLSPSRPERHNYNTATRSVSAQSDAGGSPVSVISVGAVCSASAAAAAVFPPGAGSESCNDRTNSTPEFFSSRGPTLDGRQKPDLVAIDGVAITGAGGFPELFFGTSAASPHIGGQAALLLQAAPCLVSGATGARPPDAARARLRDLIISSARPLSPAPDNVVGAGLANVFASVERTLPARAGGAAVVVSGNTATGAAVSAADLGFADPSQCEITTMTASGGCSLSAAGEVIACPFGTSQVSVAASNNGVAFSPPANLQVTVSSFTVAGAPSTATVTAGQSASYQVTVSASGGAFGSNVALSCGGLPAGASCSFNPSTVVPGATGMQTTLTITTAPRTAAVATVLGWPAVAGGLTIIVVIGWARSASRVEAGPSSWRAGTLVPAVTLVLAACAGGRPPQPPAEPQPAVSLSAANLSFGNQVTQTPSAAQTLTVRNTGDAALTIASIAATGDYAQTTTCGTSLAPNATCNITVSFIPQANGARAGAVTITDNASGSPRTVGLSGTGVAPTGGTPPGTYPISVSGTTGTLLRAGVVTLIVQ